MKDGRVTRLAVARAVRGVSCLTLGRRVGVSANQISAWERGQSPVPNRAMRLRLALALAWPEQDLTYEPMDHESAWSRLVSARQRAAEG